MVGDGQTGDDAAHAEEMTEDRHSGESAAHVEAMMEERKSGTGATHVGEVVEDLFYGEGGVDEISHKRERAVSPDARCVSAGPSA